MGERSRQQKQIQTKGVIERKRNFIWRLKDFKEFAAIQKKTPKIVGILDQEQA